MTMRDRFDGWRNPHRLYRDPERGKLAGVCAGIGDYFGIDPWILRGVALLGLVFFTFVTIVVYVALAIVLKPKPPRLYRDEAEAAFWRGVTTAPDRTFHALRRHFRELEARLRRIENEVTSDEFELRRKFRDLGA